jgi:hypothetical protein
MAIYLTHCSKDKSEAAKASGEKLPPDQLYTDPGLLAFIQRCQQTGSSWAILSDKYGVIFPWESHEYYEKPPATVTPEEEKAITADFHTRLAEFGEIYFYVRSGSFHPFYKRVIMSGPLAGNVVLFEDFDQIGINATSP